MIEVKREFVFCKEGWIIVDKVRRILGNGRLDFIIIVRNLGVMV